MIAAVVHDTPAGIPVVIDAVCLTAASVAVREAWTLTPQQIDELQRQHLVGTLVSPDWLERYRTAIDSLAVLTGELRELPKYEVVGVTRVKFRGATVVDVEQR